MFNQMLHTVLKLITTLLGIGLMGLSLVGQAESFYTGPLWDAHSHVDRGSLGVNTQAFRIADAINGAPAGTTILDGTTRSYLLPQALPGTERILLMPKKRLDNYMQNNLATSPFLQKRLITGIGFQNAPTAAGANDGWLSYVSSTAVYSPSEDLFLNYVETRAAEGSDQWLGEVVLYGRQGAAADIVADPFDPIIEDRISRVLDIAADSGLAVTIHNTVNDMDGNPIGDLTGTATDTVAERFKSILQAHADNAVGGVTANVVWAHWAGLSSPTEVQDLIDQFSNLYFDLSLFSTGLTAFQPDGLANGLLNPGCNIENLALCVFTPEWELLISSNPGRFLAGMDAGRNPEYNDYQVRELILREALGSLDAADAQLIAAGNLQQLSGVVPIPASVWLFSSGLLGLIGIARRKKAV